MRFQVLSHAGLLVEGQSKSLTCDPWILGSCYWRSWWNYLPVSPELVASLNPDYIYITHVHWDHFQGPSLLKLGKDKQILVPKGNYDRIKRDLVKMGFKNIRELRHGEAVQLAPDFKVTSYQFGIFLDSALVIECEGVKILNLNDAKFMGLPLQEMIQKHGPFDFVLRSHSSANSRLSYQITDEPETPVDDVQSYIDSFTDTVRAVPATYAVPFASNQCHLMPEVFKFNTMARTPKMVGDYFIQSGFKAPELKVMVSGDAWSSTEGFHYTGIDYFTDRDRCLAEYQAQEMPKIEAHLEKEAKSKINLPEVRRYFDKLGAAIPWILRRPFKGHPIAYVLKAGETLTTLKVDLYNRSVEQIETLPDDSPLPQIHTAAYIFNQCIRLDLFSHLSISKRVLFKVRKKDKKYIQKLNLLYNLYEYDMLPLTRLFSWRFIETWLLRWREIILYVQLVRDLVLHRKLNFAKYLQPVVK